MSTLDQLFQTAVQHHHAGRLAEAEQFYRQVLAQQPNHPDALHLLGALAAQVGRNDIAANLIRQAIALRPNFPNAHYNLGNVMDGTGQLNEAIAAYRQAVAFRPDYPEAYSNLGIALQSNGQLDQAIAAHRQAIVLRPNYSEAYNNLGNALSAQGQLDQAIAAYRQAIALWPNFPDSHSNLVLNLHYHPGFDTSAIAQELARWNQQHGEPLRKEVLPHRNDRTPGRRLRIGYVSPDFRSHPVGRFLLPLLANHDHQNVEVFCYSHVAVPDALTQQLREHADHWHSIVGLSDPQAADLVRQHQIDILIDLASHTARNRLLLFARKPAPIQATYMAYPGTSGLNTIDYRLSDPYLDPPGMDESIYSEQTIRLPHSFWCYDPLDAGQIAVNAPPASVNKFITFGCLNNFCKINDAVLALWARVMQAVPDSRLLILAPEGSARKRVLERLGTEGVAVNRIEFAPYQSRQKYFELYHRIDVGLDTFPYNGHTTSLDSFWMGVPVVTLVGQTVVGRAGLGQLMNLELPELIAETSDRYVQIAAALANDRPRLAELRGAIRPRMERSPLMDAPGFARDIEGAYRQTWTQWCARGAQQAGS